MKDDGFGAPRVDPGETEEQLEERRKAAHSRFAELGAEHVRQLLAIDGLPFHMQAFARDWLTKGSPDAPQKT